MEELINIYLSRIVLNLIRVTWFLSYFNSNIQYKSWSKKIKFDLKLQNLSKNTKI